MKRWKLAGWLVIGSAFGVWPAAAQEPAAPEPTPEEPAGEAPKADASANASAADSNVRRDPKGIKGISPFWESLKLGDSAYLARDYDNAIGQYLDAITKDPRNPLGHLRMAEALMKKQSLKEAEQALQAAARFAEGDPSLKAKVLFLLAVLQEDQKAYDAATAAWKEYQEFGRQQPHAKVHQRTPPERQKRIATAKQLAQDYAAVKERIEKRLKAADDAAKKNAQ